MVIMTLFLMGIYVIIMLIGAIHLLVSFILFVVRCIKKRRKKTVGSVSKVLAIYFLIVGILAETPMLIAMGGFYMEELNKKEAYESLENKVSVGSDLPELNGDKKEFEYNGDTLVAVEELENRNSFYDDPDKQKSVFVANLVTDHSDDSYVYTEMRKTQNASGYDIYVVLLSGCSCYYVKKEDKEKVIDYYMSQAEYIAEVENRKSNDSVECEVDIQRLRDIAANSKTKVKCPVSAEKDYYDLEIRSTDYICEYCYTFCYINDCVLLEPEEHKKNVKGYLLSKEDEAYIRDVFAKANQ